MAFRIASYSTAASQFLTEKVCWDVMERDSPYCNTQPGSEGYLGRYPLLGRVLESASTKGFSEKDRDLAVASRGKIEAQRAKMSELWDVKNEVFPVAGGNDSSERAE